MKAVSECYMPVSGTIHEVNAPLTESPNAINKSPLDQGMQKSSSIKFNALFCFYLKVG